MINLTPHTIVVRLADGTDLSIPSEGVARVSQVSGAPIPTDDCPDGLPCWTPSVNGTVEGLPEPKEGVTYLVSGMVAAAVRRKDVYSPGTGPNDGAVRNDKGQVVAVTRLIRSC